MIKMRDAKTPVSNFDCAATPGAAVASSLAGQGSAHETGLVKGVKCHDACF